MKVEFFEVGRLKEYEQNTRIHSQDQVNEVSRSIKEFGFTNPILVDEFDVIIAGHCRLRAAKSIGMEEVPVIVLSHLDPEQRAALTIADNKLALNSMWDEGLLRDELANLLDNDFDISLIGFTEQEYESLSLAYEDSSPSDIDEKLNDMALDVPRGIQVEFSDDRYEEGRAKFAELRELNPLVGNAILDALLSK